MSKFPLPEVGLQCCDADGYVGYGKECALSGKCFGDLRPMGDYLWFSVPERLDWPVESLILVNIIVAAASVVLSLFALRALLFQLSGQTAGRLQALLLFLLTTAIHAVFLRPTVFNTLSDPPANMLLLSGVWLLILAHCAKNTVKKFLGFAVVGVLLGSAAWLRAFYLYPVLCFLAVYFLQWIFSRNRKTMELLLLLALLPIETQFVVMYKEYGTCGYLNEETTSRWSDMHLNQPFTGFDTVFPRNGHFWQPRYCEAKLGILNGLQNGDFKGVSCVLAERLMFYFGTYEPDTYIFSNLKNQLVRQFAESIGSEEADWFPRDLAWEANVTLSPAGQPSADKLTVTQAAPDGRGDVVQWVILRGNQMYTFSVWLWSPYARTINIAIKRHVDDALVALQTVTLTPEPTRYFTTGMVEQAGLYDVAIGRTPYQQYPITMGVEPGEFFYAWGAQLEPGDQPTAFIADEWTDPDSVRHWRPWLLILNLVVMLAMLCAVVRDRAFWLWQRAGLSVIALFVVVAMQCLAIIPEQRFAIGMMIFMWLVAVTFVFRPRVVSHRDVVA